MALVYVPICVYLCPHLYIGVSPTALAKKTLQKKIDKFTWQIYTMDNK